jgi:hypothetical protein
VFGYNPENVLVTESGVPATVPTRHARIYVDLSGEHNTGLAIVNPTRPNANIIITAFQSDGVTGIGTSAGPLQLSANGHSAHFAGEFIAGLPAEFMGMLDITSTTPFAAFTMRSQYNEQEKMKAKAERQVKAKAQVKGRQSDSMFESVAKSTLRALGSHVGRQLVRGLLGGLLGGTTRRRN